MQFASKGILVEVLFDETLVKYNWPEERKFEITEIVLASEDKARVEELKKLTNADNELEESNETNETTGNLSPILEEEEEEKIQDTITN